LVATRITLTKILAFDLKPPFHAPKNKVEGLQTHNRKIDHILNTGTNSRSNMPEVNNSGGQPRRFDHLAIDQ